MLASVSKTVTWAALTILLNKDQIQLEDKVSTHLGASFTFPYDLKDTLKIKHLFTHSSGMKDNAPDPTAGQVDSNSKWVSEFQGEGDYKYGINDSEGAYISGQCPVTANAYDFPAPSENNASTLSSYMAVYAGRTTSWQENILYIH